jgi:hypothetical protein
MISKNAEFHADFKSVEKVLKKCTPVEKPVETQHRLASHLVRAPNSRSGGH